MEPVNYPPRWFSKPDPDHHADCPAYSDENAECDCARLDEIEKVIQAEARYDAMRDR